MRSISTSGCRAPRSSRVASRGGREPIVQAPPHRGPRNSGTVDRTLGEIGDTGRHHTGLKDHLTRSCGAPGKIRTCDTRFKKPMLYPLTREQPPQPTTSCRQAGGHSGSLDRRRRRGQRSFSRAARTPRPGPATPAAANSGAAVGRVGDELAVGVRRRRRSACAGGTAERACAPRRPTRGRRRRRRAPTGHRPPSGRRPRWSPSSRVTPPITGATSSSERPLGLQGRPQRLEHRRRRRRR